MSPARSSRVEGPSNSSTRETGQQTTDLETVPMVIILPTPAIENDALPGVSKLIDAVAF